MPTVTGPSRASTAGTSAASERTASVVARRRRLAVAQQDGAVRAQHGVLDLGAAEIDSHAQRSALLVSAGLAPPASPPQDSGMAAETLLDVKGMNCPLPVLRANRALRGLQPGDKLRVLATDRAAVADFRAFCRETGTRWSA